ncbi:DMT family transporter [Haloarculaceae archaeon H-GB2-1]|nr:DMT family transporter [Haloarculaceae archaeon H-GB11]MEA5409451.1 DMT family transporter [Haloarculaceae archaeon H-GB2-1]
MKRYYDVLALLGLILVRGLSFPAFEFGLDAFPVLMLTAFRLDIAAIVLFGYVLATNTDWRPTTRGDYIAIGSGGIVAFALANGLWSMGQEMTTATFAGLMAGLVPITTAGFSWVLLPRDRLSPLGVVGLGVGFGGAMILMLPEGGLHFSPTLVGKLLVFAGVTAAGLGGVLIRWATPRSRRRARSRGPSPSERC